MSDSEFTWTISNDPVDESSIVITGSATVSYTGMVTVVNQEKLCFSIDLEVGGTIEVTVETASTQYTIIESYEPYEPLDLNELTWEVVPDCGEGSGQIEFSAGMDQTPLVAIHSPFLGTQFQNTVQNVPDSSYIVFVEDLYCPIDTLIGGIVVPDGSLTATVTFNQSVLNCVNDSLDASGFVPGAFLGDVSGGSGFYDVTYLTAGGSPVSFVDFGLEALEEGGFYSVLIEDQQSSCDVFVEVEVLEDSVEVGIELVELIPLVVNSAIVLQEGSFEVEGIYDGSSGSFSYSWSPSGGVGSSTSIYLELTTPGIYTVVATYAGNSCSVELELDLVEELCDIPADFNNDGAVNWPDLSLFLQAYGNPCSACPQDFNQNGNVDADDLNTMMSMLGMSWQSYCGF